jgi:hypothetical protein
MIGLESNRCKERLTAGESVLSYHKPENFTTAADGAGYLSRNPLVIQNPVVKGSRGHANLT